jgi:hypothetical protein
MRDTERKLTTRTALDDAGVKTGEKKRPQVVGFRRTPEKQDRFSGSSRRVQSIGGGRTVAGLDATNANGLLTRKSPDR